MGDLWFQLLAHSEADRTRLNGEIAGKMVAEDIIGYETMLTVTPDDVELHDDVAVLYLGMGKPLDAVRHFRASAARRPDAAPARYNLGTALTMAGQLDEAARELERAVALDPGYGVAYANLGSVLLQQGRVAQAITRLEKAVALSPGNAEALNSLSAAYAVSGDTARALDTIDRALALQPPPALQRVLRQRRELLTRPR
jgi:Flp pilus assembly protein TadD